MQKRIVDLIVVSCGLVVAVPIAAVIALSIKLDSSGPVLFFQDRLGKNQKVFRCLKFRTMRCDAGGPGWTVTDDPRVTKVGRVLRALHLDELPQLVNVIRGEMSIVGPRPIVECEAALFSALQPPYNARFTVLPGMTGLAQISVAPDAHLAKFKLDVFYVRHQSLMFDLRIMLRTAGKVLHLDGEARRRMRRLDMGRAS